MKISRVELHDSTVVDKKKWPIKAIVPMVEIAYGNNFSLFNEFTFLTSWFELCIKIKSLIIFTYPRAQFNVPPSNTSAY